MFQTYDTRTGATNRLPIFFHKLNVLGGQIKIVENEWKGTIQIQTLQPGQTCDPFT